MIIFHITVDGVAQVMFCKERNIMLLYVESAFSPVRLFDLMNMLALLQYGNARFIGIVNQTIGERCPDSRLEREIRAINTSCSPLEYYHCLFNSDDMLVESCYDYKQVPAGHFPKFNSYGTGNPIDYDECPPDRYQAWPIKSFEIKECSSLKSECTSEGQMICNDGDLTTDRTCKCDYKKGYVLNEGRCCSPSARTDCFCFKKTCEPGQILDADYNCIDGCHDALNCSSSTTETTITYFHTTQDLKPLHYIGYYPRLLMAYIIAGAMATAFFLAIVIRLKKYRYEGKPKYGLVFFFWVIIGIVCVILSEYDDYKNESGRIVIQFCLLVLILVSVIGCISGIFIVYYYKIPKRFLFFTEEYEIEIYNILQAAKEGDLEHLKKLHEKKTVDFDEVDYNHRSPLHIASCEGQADVVEFLLKNQLCNIKAKDRALNTANDDAMRHNASNEGKSSYQRILELLDTQSSSKTNHNETLRERTCREMMNATKNGHLSELKRLKQNDTDMNHCNSSGRTVLHIAAENGMENVVDFLINECHVSPFVWWTGKRPVDCIPNDNEEKTVRIRQKLDAYMKTLKESSTTETLPPDIPESTQVVRMFHAALRGDLRLLKQFRENNYNMTISDYDDSTLLHVAVCNNQEHVVEFLLSDEQFRENIFDKKDRWNRTPFMIARDSDDDKIFYTFLKYYKELVDTENDEYRTYQLLTASAEGNVTTLKRLQRQKVDMNLRDYDGRTALHLAVAENREDAVKFLLNEARVKSSIPDRENRRPIDAVDIRENIKEMLSNAENGIDESNEQFCVPNEKLVKVMHAAARGILHKLENDDYRFSFFPMDSFDYFKNTPLHVAASKARKSDVEYLLGKNVSPFMRNSFWKTPAQLVKKKKGYWKAKQKNCKSKQKKQFAKTRKEEFDNILKILVDAEESSSNEEDENFKKYKNGERVFLFLNKAYKGDIKAIQRYLKTDKDLINKYDYDGRTALHLATAERHEHLVKFILNQDGIKKDIKDRWGMTPLCEAKELNDEAMIELLDMP